MRGGKRFKSSTLTVYISALQHVHKFLKREPQHLRGTITSETLDKISVVLKGCLTSMQKRRAEEEAANRIVHIGSYCSPGILGAFSTVRLSRKPGVRSRLVSERRTAGAFFMIGNCWLPV